MIQILPLDFLVASHRIPWKNKNAVYCLQISALVLEIFVFEKYVKYANEMPDVSQTIETWQANSFKGTHQWLQKFCSHGNSLFYSPHQLYFNLLVIFSTKNI